LTGNELKDILQGGMVFSLCLNIMSGYDMSAFFSFAACHLATYLLCHSFTHGSKIEIETLCLHTHAAVALWKSQEAKSVFFYVLGA
jgi:hypothetical protein